MQAFDMFGDHVLSRVGIVLCLVWVACAARPADASGKLGFTRGKAGDYAFDTGILRGTLAADGKTFGLSSVIHVPTEVRLDSGAGICSYYRVFTANKRYGHAAWDWPGESELLPSGAVRITWPKQRDRPFEMVATYRWSSSTALDVETIVKPSEDLPTFEVFLASYFSQSLPAPYVCVKNTTAGRPRLSFLPAERSHGHWLMFLRDKALLSIVQDGRWRRKPNPVDWTIMPEMGLPIAFRRGAAGTPTGVVMAPPDDCFAISTPYRRESHYSLYLSLFGHDVKAGETARARTRFAVTIADSDREVLDLYRDYVRRLEDSDSPSVSGP